MNAAVTWHQLTIGYEVYCKDREEVVTQLGVLERLEMDNDSDSWRFAYIE